MGPRTGQQGLNPDKRVIIFLITAPGQLAKRSFMQFRLGIANSCSIRFMKLENIVADDWPHGASNHPARISVEAAAMLR